jgi:hypothetical protein
MLAEAVHHVAKKSARRASIRRETVYGLQLYKCIFGAHSALESGLGWVELCILLVPHQFDIPHWAGVVDHQKEMFKQLQILLKFPP